jgi:hypothetical protein
LTAGSSDRHLTFAELAARASRFPELRVGQIVSGRLSDRALTLSHDAPVAGYTFRGNAGETVEIEMRSEDFDAFLHLGRVGGEEPLATNDDGPDSTDSLLRFRLPDTATYVILASALHGGEEGEFTLSLRRID